MYANLRKEVLDEDGKVVFRDTFSLNLETTSPELLEYWTSEEKGYCVDNYTENRMY